MALWHNLPHHRPAPSGRQHGIVAGHTGSLIEALPSPCPCMLERPACLFDVNI